MRLPAAWPSAVRLALLLTGKPRMSATAMLERTERQQFLISVDPLAFAGERPPGEHDVAEGDHEYGERRADQLAEVSGAAGSAG